jgi:catechol 2,3-dioxygenase-like lactoylglutathione lyase family enzyme
MELAFVMLGSSDVERSATFYRDVLGLEPGPRFEDFAFFNTGAVTLALSGELGRRSGEHESCEFVFGVSSVREAYERAKERGVAFVNEPRPVNAQNWAVNFNDPDGHLLSFYGSE